MLRRRITALQAVTPAALARRQDAGMTPAPLSTPSARARSPAAFLSRMALLALVIFPIVAGAAARAPAGHRQACHAVSRAACDTAHALGRGVNLGNMLDAPREGDWGVRAEPFLIEAAASRFQTVRLPVRWSNHAAPTADATIDEAFARRVDEVVDALLARGVWVILDMHHYSQAFGDPLHPREFAVAPQVVDERLVNLWTQVARRYQDRSPRLLFELLNEPHRRLEGEAWNLLAARALAAVRATNPTRVVMIGPGEWNHPRALPQLRLPADRHLIAAVHTYDPFGFTHQGVTWRTPVLPAGVPCCDERQRQEVVSALEAAAQWNRAQGVPVHLGEFGAHVAADMDSRVAYARLVRGEAERRAIGWAWWEFAADFSPVYDPRARAWVEPLRRALLGEDEVR